MLKVLSFQIADSIDIKQFQQSFVADVHHSDNDELYYKIDKEKFIYIFKFGIVCFLNHNEIEITAFIKLLTPYCKHILAKRLSEEFEIETNAHKMKFGYNKIEIQSADIESLRIIMLNVSQSVALDHYSQQTNKLREETNRLTEILGHNGKLDISSTDLKKTIGRTLSLKNRILENLYIFDSPDETWEDENLNILDVGLKKTFDLQVRFRDISEGLGIVKENLELFKDLLQSKNSIVLEWVVIVLIFIEVINLIVDKIFK